MGGTEAGRKRVKEGGRDGKGEKEGGREGGGGEASERARERPREQARESGTERGRERGTPREGGREGRREGGKRALSRGEVGVKGCSGRLGPSDLVPQPHAGHSGRLAAALGESDLMAALRRSHGRAIRPRLDSPSPTGYGRGCAVALIRASFLERCCATDVPRTAGEVGGGAGWEGFEFRNKANLVAPRATRWPARTLLGANPRPGLPVPWLAQPRRRNCAAATFSGHYAVIAAAGRLRFSGSGVPSSAPGAPHDFQAPHAATRTARTAANGRFLFWARALFAQHRQPRGHVPVHPWPGRFSGPGARQRG